MKFSNMIADVCSVVLRFVVSAIGRRLTLPVVRFSTSALLNAAASLLPWRKPPRPLTAAYSGRKTVKQ
ncbi:hypothetical protein KCP71_16040 [Salmonella enterica subsp. enterica]|nr:hypothetical protein KCP71_16040 [Salmonella enterica subsp. enterica]